LIESIQEKIGRGEGEYAEYKKTIKQLNAELIDLSYREEGSSLSEVLAEGDVAIGAAPLEGVLKELTARYVAQWELEGGEHGDFKRCVDEVKEFVKKLYSEHFPLYDIAFSELDDMRDNEPGLLEVYLGRDGIYAYVARHAQWSVASDREKAGEWKEPKCITYPRLFIQSLQESEKLAYMQSRGITKDEKLVMFDLCYNGSVPEDMLKTLGYSESEVDDNIFMLSAHDPRRRFQSINPKYDKMVADMQYGPKMEKRAVGLHSDPETGDIEVLAEATDPEDQFQSLLVEYLIDVRYRVKASSQ